MCPSSLPADDVERGLWLSVNCIIHTDSVAACPENARTDSLMVGEKKRGKKKGQSERVGGSENRCNLLLRASLKPEFNLYYILQLHIN